MARRVCLLGMGPLPADYPDDDAALPIAFAAAGVDTVKVNWHEYETVDFSQFDACLVRQTWDYQKTPAAFLRCIAAIAAKTRVLNDAAIIEWNVDKRYLRGINAAGCRTVPTAWGAGVATKAQLLSLFRELLPSAVASTQDGSTCYDAVIKPTVSATSYDTFRLRFTLPASAAFDDASVAVYDSNTSTWGGELSDSGVASTLGGVFAADGSDRHWMLQPFVASITSVGEYAVFTFAGQYSHAMLKRAKAGDFRVQDTYGGTNAFIPKAELPAGLAETAAAALAALPKGDVLFSRVDIVRGNPTDAGVGAWEIMEVEVTEPGLYFDVDPPAAERFVSAALGLMGSPMSA